MTSLDDLEKLASLKKKGVISEEEFEAQKKEILNTTKRASATAKSRVAYILLGIFLGHFGIHNFYAGYSGKGVAQLLITLLTGVLVIPLLVVFVWVLIEVCTVDEDANGVKFI